MKSYVCLGENSVFVQQILHRVYHTYSIYMIPISIPKYSFVLYYLYSMYVCKDTDGQN